MSRTPKPSPLNKQWRWPGAGKGRRFTPDQVRAIRAIEGRTMQDIADEYGVSSGVIHRIRSRQSYQDVE